MAFTFDPTLPRLRDHARLALGDFESESAIFGDEIYDAKLGGYGYLEGVAQLADAMAIRISHEPSRFEEGTGGLGASWSGRVEALHRLASDCRVGIVPDPGGQFRHGVSATLPTPPGLIL